MYAWLWRHLPFHRWQYKLATCLVLVVGIGTLLWYVVFPWAEPLLPFDDVQVTDTGGVPGGPTDIGGSSDPGVGPAGDEHDIPYDTDENNPEPSATPNG